MRSCCYLFGCNLDGPACIQCGAALYDYEFIEKGKLTPVIDFFFKIKHILIFPRCEVCNKRLPLFKNKKYINGYVCSDKCFDKWLPF